MTNLITTMAPHLLKLKTHIGHFIVFCVLTVCTVNQYASPQGLAYFSTSSFSGKSPCSFPKPYQERAG